MEKKNIRRDHPLGLYLHIPFCKAKCAYCDFYSLRAQRGDRWTPIPPRCSAHLVEVARRRRTVTSSTPSISAAARRATSASKRLTEPAQDGEEALPASQQEPEITVEANPDSACDWKALRALRRAGVEPALARRCSPTDDALLQAHRARPHLRADVQRGRGRRPPREASKTSVSTSSTACPARRWPSWEKTLAGRGRRSQPEHLSCYGLKLEPRARRFLRGRGSCTFPDDDAQADMYLYAVALPRASTGYEQYEISNFAKPGLCLPATICKYWTARRSTAGFGPGAHSDFGDVRYGYLRDIDRYIAGELVLSERETISRRERDMEYIMLRLRLARGADPREFENAFRERFNPLAKLLHQYAAHGLACQNDDGSWRLTPKGFLVSNQIIGALQEELSREKADRLARAARGDYRVID